MTKKQPKNTDKELLERATHSPFDPEAYEPDITALAIATVNAIPASVHRAWFEKRGLPMPEEYQEGYDPLDEDDERKSWVGDNEFNPVRIISPKNAKYSD